jgi:hypothetical protein
MKYSHRFFLWTPVAVLVALLAAAAIHWFIAADAFGKYLDRANGHEIAPGVTLHFAHRQLAGFPFRLDLVLDDLKIGVDAAHGPMEWRSEHFAMHMLDYGRVQAIYEAAGRQTIAWTNDDGARKSLAFTPALLRASAIDAHGRLSRFDLELVGASSPDLRAAALQFHVRRAPDADALDIVLNADDLHLSPEFKSAFGTVITKLRLNARLHPATPLTPLLSGKREWRANMNAWNGAFDIGNLEVAWGKTDVSGSGRLTLDAAHRPQGILDLKIAGLDAIEKKAGKGFFSTLLNAIAQNAPVKNNAPVRVAFKDGLVFANNAPAGFLSPLY